jgi:hypothetical protein
LELEKRTTMLLIREAREVMLPLLILGAFVSPARVLRGPRSAPASYNIALQPEAPRDIKQDPRFRLLLENSDVRVFAFTLPASEQSLVRHEYHWLTLTLEDSEVILWRDGESPINHYRFRRGEIHFYDGKSDVGIRNDSKSAYRNVVVEFLDPGVTNYGYRYDTGKWDYGPTTPSVPVDPAGHFVNTLDLERATAADVQLLPKESLPPSGRRQLLVGVTPLQGSLGGRKIRLDQGEVLWLEDRSAGLVNDGQAPARFAVVEFKSKP